MKPNSSGKQVFWWHQRLGPSLQHLANEAVFWGGHQRLGPTRDSPTGNKSARRLLGPARRRFGLERGKTARHRRRKPDTRNRREGGSCPHRLCHHGAHRPPGLTCDGRFGAPPLKQCGFKGGSPRRSSGTIFMGPLGFRAEAFPRGWRKLVCKGGRAKK